MTAPVQEWWQTIDDAEAVHLAKKLVPLFMAMPPETMVLPYEPQMHVVPGRPVIVVPAGQLVPLWTRFLSVARAALNARDEVAIEATLAMPDVIASPKGTDQLWRENRGLTDGTEAE